MSTPGNPGSGGALGAGLVITVRGTSRQLHPAERATVHARVALEGPQPGPVLAGVAEQTARVRESVLPMHDPEAGPITWWSAQDVRTWAVRPWNQDGKQLPLVHHARADLQVKFSDFARLASWLQQLAPLTGFGVDHVEWALTVSRRQELARVARTRAVREAQAKAQAYADALKLGGVRPVAIAEAGMLEAGLHPATEQEAPFARAMAAKGGGETELQLVPRDLEVSASVDARFVAEGQ